MLTKAQFLITAQTALAICARGGLPATLVYFDLRQCSTLRLRFVETLGETFRESDVVGPLGMNVFGAVLINTPLPGAGFTVERFGKRLGHPFTYGLLEVEGQGAPCIDDLLRRVNTLLRENQRSGRLKFFGHSGSGSQPPGLMMGVR